MKKLSDLSQNELIQEIGKMKARKQSLRQRERDLAGKSQYLNMMPVVADDGDLRGNLNRVLPKHLVPSNVGELNQIMFPHWYEVEFDTIGTNPNFDNNTRFSKYFQVSTEFGFLLCSVSRTFKDVGLAGALAPLQITIRDNQSARQFNDRPIPIQHIGYHGKPTMLDTPMLIMPKVSITVELTSWIPSGLMASTGDGYQHFAFGGYRVAISDFKFLANQIFL